jgi:hypothetical protein
MISRSATRRKSSQHQHRHRTRRQKIAAIDHAVRLIHRICCLAGSADLIDEVRNNNGGSSITASIRNANTPALFDWLVASLSYQGISDQVAEAYMDQHGYVAWTDIRRKLSRGAACPKLKSYWHFHGCRYDKVSRTCTEPDHIAACPLPTHDLRNGRLNQMAYSLFLFIRDVCDGDLVSWIDQRLHTAVDPANPNRLAELRETLIGPLREVYGVSDKVLTMTLSGLLLAAPGDMPVWVEVGGSMIAVDTLVHNFLVRTGILRRFDADHAYGMACYRPGGCASIIEAVSGRIDARQFNPAFPRSFPRFVQHAIWRSCSQNGLDVCNGNRIDDRKSCCNVYCQIYNICDRISLYDKAIYK